MNTTVESTTIEHQQYQQPIQFDVYGDLTGSINSNNTINITNTGINVLANRLQYELDTVKSQLTTVSTELSTTQTALLAANTTNKKLIKTLSISITNISKLYNTAKAELINRDNTIKLLRNEKRELEQKLLLKSINNNNSNSNNNSNNNNKRYHSNNNTNSSNNSNINNTNKKHRYDNTIPFQSQSISIPQSNISNSDSIN